ncbi:hypothetical protein MPSEU_000008100 [Mayamaea pseudoterrestris]|nr:hypothetical protein MPSEU_000008100 [Mayamaea pseudoterrestris]
MDQATSSSTYTTAVALNNMAVSLLERKCYRQALETLHDSVQLTRKHRTTASSGSQAVSPSLPQHIAVDYAHQRQCKPEPFKQADSSSSFQVVSDDSDAMTCLRSCVDSCVGIRLEGFDSTIDAQVDSAVILHNYAMAALSLAMTATKNPTTSSTATKKRLLQTCLKSLLQCQKELSSRYAQLDMDVDFALVHKVFVVAVVSTNSLLQVLQQLGTEEYGSQIVECQAKLVALKETLSDLDHAEVGGIMAAAAA